MKSSFAFRATSRILAVLALGAVAAGPAIAQSGGSGAVDDILIRRGPRMRPDNVAAPASKTEPAPAAVVPAVQAAPATPVATNAPAAAVVQPGVPGAAPAVAPRSAFFPSAMLPTPAAILTSAPPVSAAAPAVVAAVTSAPPETATSSVLRIAPMAPAESSGGGIFFDLFGGKSPRGSAKPSGGPATSAPVTPMLRPPANNAPTTAVRARDRLEEGIALAREKRNDEAIQVLEEVIRLDPTSMPAWEQLGWCYWAAGRREDAIVLWNRLLALDPGNPAAYSLLGRAAVANNDLDKAIEYNRKSLELNPNQPNVRFDLARTLLWRGAADDAMPMLEQVILNDPTRIDVILELARAKTSAWQFESALPLWQKLRETAPDELSYMAAEALCRLHTNEPEAARELATRVLDASPTDLYALDVMACLAEFGDKPETALPYLRRLVEESQEPTEKERWRVRLIKLNIRLNRAEPRVYGLREAVDLTRERVAYNPKSADARLLLGELLLLDGMQADAEREFIHVLREMNPYNIRARRGLLETYLSAKQYAPAREQLAAISRFNPQDPYLLYQLARLESARGDYFKAHEALDKLEAAGRQGAAAVLLYHGLTPSRYFAEALSIERLREHMTALQRARVRFVKCSELPALLGQNRTQTPTSRPMLLGAGLARPAGAVPLSVAISFDDARRDSMKYGTELGKELGLTFSMHVPVGYIQRNHSFISTWDMLQKYKEEGCWEFGGHMLDGAILAPVDASGREWHALPNLTWNKDLKRMETVAEYDRRLSREFSESRRILMEQLGGPMNFAAYPFGDIGQEDETNADDPAGRILTHARRNFEVGFIQSVFGYAVAGDDPLLYQRHEMDRWSSGEDVVDYLYEHHPVYLARRLRAEYSALEGKLYRAREALNDLEQDGYPERPLAKVKKYVNDRLSQAFGSAAPGQGSIQKSPWTIEIRKPYVGANGEYFQDNQDRRSWRLFGLAGVNVTPNLLLEGRAGIGRLTQDVTDILTNPVPAGSTASATTTQRTRRIDIDERSVGGRAVFTFPNGIYISGDILQRSFSGDVDRNMIAWALETQVRPFQPVDILARYEHDMAPSALAIAEDIDYNLWTLVGNARLRDDWNLVAAVTHYDFSDDNTRDHLTAGTSWTLDARTGLKLGVRASYDTSENESRAYWTPYHLQRYYAEGGFQGNRLRTYYNVRLRLGIGKEDVRPEEEQRYRDTVARAAAQSFDPGDPPEEDWEPVFGLAASARKAIGEHWMINGEFSYNKNPNYNELTLLGGLRYKF
jgi:tetratricopeptide (TPR) repeat protein